MDNVRVCREKLQNRNVKIYEANSVLIFSVINDRVFIFDNFHTYFLKHTHRNYIPRLNHIKELIQTNKMPGMADLFTEMHLEVGEGIEMIITNLDWHLHD